MHRAAWIFASLLIITVLAAVAQAQTAAPPINPPAQKSATPETDPSAKKGAVKSEKSDKKAKSEKEDSKKSDKKSDKKSVSGKPPSDVKTLISEDLTAGTGKVASKGKTIKVHYTGWFYDQKQPQGHGMQLDSSAGKEPFSFTLGAKQVITGWDEGLVNMKVGGKRKLVIPSDMAYGSRGSRDGFVGPNQPLIFEVELLDVVDVGSESTTPSPTPTSAKPAQTPASHP